LAASLRNGGGFCQFVPSCNKECHLFLFLLFSFRFDLPIILLTINWLRRWRPIGIEIAHSSPESIFFKKKTADKAKPRAIVGRLPAEIAGGPLFQKGSRRGKPRVPIGVAGLPKEKGTGLPWLYSIGNPVFYLWFQKDDSAIRLKESALTEWFIKKNLKRTRSGLSGSFFTYEVP